MLYPAATAVPASEACTGGGRRDPVAWRWCAVPGTTSSASTVALRVPVERPGGKTASALFTPHVPGYVTNDSGHLPTAGPPWILMTCPEQMEVFVMKPLLLWIAVPMMLLGAGMLIAGIGATALWIAVIAVGIAMVAVGRAKPGAAGRK